MVWLEATQRGVLPAAWVSVRWVARRSARNTASGVTALNVESTSVMEAQFSSKPERIWVMWTAPWVTEPRSSAAFSFKRSRTIFCQARPFAGHDVLEVFPLRARGVSLTFEPNLLWTCNTSGVGILSLQCSSYTNSVCVCRGTAMLA
jgi:hypothetical protein